MRFFAMMATACAAIALSLHPAVTTAQTTSLDPAPEGSFSIVMLSDTQGYLGRGTALQRDVDLPTENPVFDAETRWVVANLKSQKVAFVTHGGDIVDSNNELQWELARRYLDRFHGVVPYGLVVGNHDMTNPGDSSLFQKYFPASRFRKFPWYGGYFKGERGHPGFSSNNANSYQLFSAGGLNFVILHVECNAPNDVLRWVDTILDRYKSRFGIVVTHMFLGPIREPKKGENGSLLPQGVMQWKKVHGEAGNTPQQLWDKSFRRHPNIRLILNGDQSTPNAQYLKLTGDHGNIVHALLSDYSRDDHGHIVHSPSDYQPTAEHGGAIRIYRFSPSGNAIRVITYDTVDSKIVTTTKSVKDSGQHNFDISLDMTNKRRPHKD
ncbi:metallophosphoesterase [Sphingomonas sp. dw_22]|uniref:metallophosphoesterase n=1 Tax=Sphingomonas sp. dw_22 TaxID=2721175 RepID=UPI001BD34C0B|nr:metallophosphoesterase [Sphingomonas sp. dw_22]